jgi:hypothetical protein
MATYHADEIVAIDNSIIDLNLALVASLVFACPFLPDYLEKPSKS